MLSGTDSVLDLASSSEQPAPNVDSPFSFEMLVSTKKEIALMFFSSCLT